VARARIPALLVLLPALALGACGGGDDEEDIEQTVRGFVDATNDQDAETLCGELVTQDFLEKTTGATGDEAKDECRRQLGALQGLSLKLDRIRRTEIDGDRASVTAVLTTQGSGSAAPRVLFLEKQDGDWKLSGSSGD
jgi:ketosteroid isomerase-like protein